VYFFFVVVFDVISDSFVGGNHYAHEVDVIVEVSPKEINSSGRFGANAVQTI